MKKELVKTSTRFYLQDKYGKTEFYFGYKRTNQLQVVRKGGHYIGDVREILEDGIYVSVWILYKEAAVFIPYSEMEFIKPKNS